MRTLWYSLLAGLANLVQNWLIGRERLYKILLAPRLQALRWRLSAWRAWASFRRAYRRVPAYRDFVDRHGGKPGRRLRDGLPDLSVVPETDKGSYIEAYPHEQRCVDGVLPRTGVVVDESSGSSGRPTSWVRGPKERWATKQMLQIAYRAALGKESLFVINAFALGAWATGLNVTLSLNDVSIMKSTGPDIDKVVDTIQEFGPGYEYVVMGYPPFLKSVADCERIDWHDYRVRAVFGGEGLSEAMRRYLEGAFTEVLGSYGASDLEINMATESPFTIAVRRAVLDDESLRAHMTDASRGVVPMVFQYNPLPYFIETNAGGELVVTLNRPTNVVPKIRYNIHDLGHVMGFQEAADMLDAHGWGHLVPEHQPLRLPLLFHYGRSDQSIDFYGANVTPDSVRDALHSVEPLVPQLESFRLISREDGRHDKVMEVAVELVSGADPCSLDADDIASQVFATLSRANSDFANAYYRTASAEHVPRITIHARSTGPFAGPEKLKKSYLDSDYEYDVRR